MTALRVFLSRVLDLVMRRRRDERLTEELEAHLELLADEYVAHGLSPADARLAALGRLGGIDRVTAACREQRGLPSVEALGLDLRFAVRLLARDRTFAATAVLVLALGIGVNTMLFTILNAHTIRGLPIERADRVAYISTLDERQTDRGVSYADFQDLRAAATSVTDLAAFATAPVIVGDAGRAPERFEGIFLTSNALAAVGLPIRLGRAFRATDDRPGAPAVAMLDGGAWKARYGANPATIGRSILVNGTPATVIGIVPERSGFPSMADIWLPLSTMPGLETEARDARSLRVVGRLRDGESLATARAEIVAVSDRLAREHPETNRGVRAQVVPINERYFGRLTDPAWLAFMTVGFLVVLISCANVANLMLARAVQRAREVAIRASLGASRGRIVRQLLIEAGVLAGLGGATGLVVAAAGVRLFSHAIPENALPYWFDYSMDARVLAALAGVSAATVFVFGLVPAMSASRTDVNRILKDGGAGGGGSGHRRWTTAFLAAELALAVVMLANLALGFRVASPALPSDETIDTTEVLTATITLPEDSYRTADQRMAFYLRLGERLGGLPPISAVSTASVLPLLGGMERRLEGHDGAVAGREPAPGVWTVAIGARYFETLGLALVEGREFDEDDGMSGRAHAIVNERFARLHLGGEGPIGRRIVLRPLDAARGSPTQAEPGAEPLTIVGVAPSIRQRTRPEPDPIVYLPLRAVSPPTIALLVRSHTDTATLAARLREEVRTLDPNIPLYRVRTLAGVVRDAQWNGRLSSALIRALAGIAVALAAVGLYAVTAHRVSRRSREIGLRMALGAEPFHVRRLILSGALAHLGLGFAAGTACTVMWDRVFPSGQPDVGAADPQSLAMAAAVLLGVALMACLAPLRRAARLDPVAAIRHD